ncbi:MAG TPA: hypothetical protein VFT44_07825 [Pyrinomonadaceae bacterium]|nr:hypothetical protein [Pyrinomonadaceae bacterium]
MSTTLESLGTTAANKEDTSNEVLIARVRSKMGRVVLHPSAIEVTSDQGQITLSGSILAHKLNDHARLVFMAPIFRSI